jgi:hypothetical protein
MGTAGPPTFSMFLLRKELREQLGMSLEEFRQLPWQEAEDYILFMQMIRREEAHRQGQQGRQR